MNIYDFTEFLNKKFGNRINILSKSDNFAYRDYIEKKFLDFSKYMEFDFYLPDYNTCIEYDGIQHFEPVKYFGGISTLDKIKKSDLIKNKYCNDFKINLVRISYKDNIINKLDDFFSFK